MCILFRLGKLQNKGNWGNIAWPRSLGMALNPIFETEKPSSDQRNVAVIKFHCTSCRKKLGVQESYVGRRVRCPKCGGVSPVPQGSPGAADPKHPNERTLYAVSLCPDLEDATPPESESFFAGF